jgi:protein phosphatase PTC1
MSTDLNAIPKQHLLDQLAAHPKLPVPDLLNKTFHVVDTKLSHLATHQGTHSGCTAVTAFLRLEDSEGRPIGAAGGAGTGRDAPHAGSLATEPETEEVKEVKRRFGDGVHREKIKELLAAGLKKRDSDETVKHPDGVAGPATRRTLYTANVGDARAVLSSVFKPRALVFVLLTMFGQTRWKGGSAHL